MPVVCSQPRPAQHRSKAFPRAAHPNQIVNVMRKVREHRQPTQYVLLKILSAVAFAP
jgi:hypothetical protein